MKKNAFLALATVIVLAGCSVSPSERAIRHSFEELKSAVAQNDVAAVVRIAPFLEASPPDVLSSAVEGLGKILDAGVISRIEILDTENANIILEGPVPLSLPFTRAKGEAWVLAETSSRKKVLEEVHVR